MLRGFGHVESLNIKNGRLGIRPRSALVAPALIFELSCRSSDDKTCLYGRELRGSVVSPNGQVFGC